MPIKDFFKTTRKKKDKKDKKDKKKKDKEQQKTTEENATENAQTEKLEPTERGQAVKPGTLAALAQTVPKLPDPVRHWDSDPEPELEPEPNPEPDKDVGDGDESYVSLDPHAENITMTEYQVEKYFSQQTMCCQ